MEQNKSKFEVIYNDRVELKRIWIDNASKCQIAFRSGDIFCYNLAVDCLFTSIINVGDKKVKDWIKEYKNKIEKERINKIEKWINNHPKERKNNATIRETYKTMYRFEYDKMLYEYIMQTLHDNDFIFWKKKKNFDDVGLDDD
jgi:hypothetical protein